MDITELLIQFGLTRQEAIIYTTLMTEGALTGYEVAKTTGISRSNTYTSLAGLVDKGAAYIMEDTATRYLAVKVEEFCSNKIIELTKIKKKIEENIPLRKEEAPGYITVKGKKHILDKMRNMINEAEQRIYISVSTVVIQDFVNELRSCIKRGLKVVIITNEPFLLKGAKVYHADKLQHQIRLISDSRNVLTGDILDGDNSTCLYSKKKNLIELLKDSLKNEIQLIEATKGKCQK